MLADVSGSGYELADQIIKGQLAKTVIVFRVGAFEDERYPVNKKLSFLKNQRLIIHTCDKKNFYLSNTILEQRPIIILAEG